jgi:hypothetical protein
MIARPLLSAWLLIVELKKPAPAPGPEKDRPSAPRQEHGAFVRRRGWRLRPGEI